MIKVLDLDLLRDLVDKSGHSRFKIAVGVDISPGYLSLMLNGRRNMSVAMLNKISEFTGIDLSQAIIEK